MEVKSPSKKWILTIDEIKQLGLLNSIYEDTKADALEVSETFEYVYMYIKGNLFNLSSIDDDKLISLLKYADFLDYKQMMDYIGERLAEMLEIMSDKELSAFQHKFATIE